MHDVINHHIIKYLLFLPLTCTVIELQSCLKKGFHHYNVWKEENS